MAIQFARARFISRGQGHNVARSAAYNARDRVSSPYTGETFDFSQREEVVHHEVILPDGAPDELGTTQALWAAAQVAETRKNAQEARELVIALPADKGLTDADRAEMVTSFVREHFTNRGLAAQVDIHRPHRGEESDERNHHAHVLVTTRFVGPEGFGAKARELHGEVRKGGVVEAQRWGQLWAAHQDRYFQDRGLDIQVDPTSAAPQSHVGPVRFRAEESDQMEAARRGLAADRASVADPGAVLDALTRQNATFTRRDVERYVEKRAREEDRAGLVDRVMGSAEVVTLRPLDGSGRGVAATSVAGSAEAREGGAGRSGEGVRAGIGQGASVGGSALGGTAGQASGPGRRQPAQRYSTAAVIAEEGAVVEHAGRLQALRGFGASEGAKAAVIGAATMRPDQLTAFEGMTGAEGLTVVEGLAGAGKSYTLSAVAKAYEESGRQVVGLAPTHAVARALASDGIANTMTAAAFAFRAANDRLEGIERGAVLIVDEAGMLSTPQAKALMVTAAQMGAKVILAGDSAQFESIDRGGMFRELGERYGSVRIDQIQRQEKDWQREAAALLATGKADLAVQRYHEQGQVFWSGEADRAQAKLVRDWTEDQVRAEAAGAPETQFVFAYTNRDVDRLNGALRASMEMRGKLSGEEHRFETKHGEAGFRAGDRIVISDTDRDRGLVNGDAGIVREVTPETMTVQLDGERPGSGKVHMIEMKRAGQGSDARTAGLSEGSAAQAARPGEASPPRDPFLGVRHGYAGTIYRGQGATIDRTYLYHTSHWRAASSYVALTRQRVDAKIYANTAQKADTWKLANSMRLSDAKLAASAYGAEARPERMSAEAIDTLTTRLEQSWGRANRAVAGMARAAGVEPQNLTAEKAMPGNTTEPASAFVQTVRAYRNATAPSRREQLGRAAVYWSSFVDREQALKGEVARMGETKALAQWTAEGAKRPFDVAPATPFEGRTERPKTDLDRFKEARAALRDPATPDTLRDTYKRELAEAAQGVKADSAQMAQARQERLRLQVRIEAVKARMMTQGRGRGMSVRG